MKAKFDKHGRQKPDPTKIEVPLEFQAPPSMRDQIREVFAQELSKVASENGQETFEEADDFDIPEDDAFDQEFASKYEVSEMQSEYVDVQPSNPPPQPAKADESSHAKPKDSTQETDNQVTGEPDGLGESGEVTINAA